MSSIPAQARLRQPWLFVMNGPLGERLGNRLFARIPASPGVYRFFGENDRLLYIGQSSNLRARVGSYRFVTADRHSRRTARLVAAIRRVEWSLCESADAAIALERVLLLEHRPPFNRAGVWTPPPWWVALNEDGGSLRVCLLRGKPSAEAVSAGPLPSSFRYTFASLMRCLYRWHRRDADWWDLPHGMAGPVIPPEQSVPLSAGSFVSAASLAQFLTTGCSRFLDNLLEAIPFADDASAAGAFWTPDVEALRKFSQAVRPAAADAPAA